MIDEIVSSGAKDTPEQAAFREHCRGWIQANLPKQPGFRLPQSPLEVMTVEQLDFLQDWQKKCYDAGLVGCDYPKEYGGGGKEGFQRIANQELGRAQAPFFVNVVGLGMAGPTILHHGTEENKRRFLPGILSGEEIWCQGFSEPGAGSDLANVQTKAEPRGDKWVVTGHKVWTSLAHFAQWMILVARTSSDHKHRGLTYFLVPIESEVGKTVTVRPLIKMTGETGFNEVIIDGLEISDALRVDEIGAGWTVAMTTLMHERGASPLVTPGAGGTAMPTEYSVEALTALAKACKQDGRPVIEDGVIRDRLMALLIREEGLKQHLRRAFVGPLVDHPMRLPMQGKLLGTEYVQDVGRLAVEIAGAKGTLYVGDDNAPDDGRWPLQYMNSYGFTIAAGTSEVQRNLLGERVLGLPKTK